MNFALFIIWVLLIPLRLIEGEKQSHDILGRLIFKGKGKVIASVAATCILAVILGLFINTLFDKPENDEKLNNKVQSEQVKPEQTELKAETKKPSVSPETVKPIKEAKIVKPVDVVIADSKTKFDFSDRKTFNFYLFNEIEDCYKSFGKEFGRIGGSCNVEIEGSDSLSNNPEMERSGFVMVFMRGQVSNEEHHYYFPIYKKKGVNGIYYHASQQSTKDSGFYFYKKHGMNFEQMLNKFYGKEVDFFPYDVKVKETDLGKVRSYIENEQLDSRVNTTKVVNRKVVNETKSNHKAPRNSYNYHVFREFSSCEEVTNGSGLYHNNEIDCNPVFPSNQPSTLKTANSYELSGFVYAIKRKVGIFNRDEMFKYYPVYRLVGSGADSESPNYIYENGKEAQLEGFYNEALTVDQLDKLFLY